MAQVDSENSTGMPAPESPQDSFVSLAAAVSPAWHQAIVRLANASERVAAKLGWILENEQDNDPASVYVKNCRELVDMMLEFLDGLEEDPDLEPSLAVYSVPGGSCVDGEEEADDEPSLASLDSVANQTKWAEGGMMDAEQDDSDDEPSLGSGAVGVCSSQAQWAQGRTDDVEDVNEDGDGMGHGTVDDEPSLGSTATINQEAWSFGNNCDREQGTTRRFREPRPQR
jgi:hypothetical protein